MYSQCPDCQTRFRVTAGALRAARGTVRCGRCGSAFDALERLSDAIPPAEQEATQVPLLAGTDDATVAESGGNVEYHFSAEDLERVFVDANDWQDDATPLQAEASALPTEIDAGHEPAGVDAEPPLVVVYESTGVEDITLEGEHINIGALLDQPVVAEADVAEVDLDSTDEMQILLHVPDSAYLDEDEIEAATVDLDVGAPELPPGLVAEPAQVESQVGQPAARSTDLPGPAAAAPATTLQDVPLSAQRWRRPAEDEPLAPTGTGTAWRSLAWAMAGLLLALALAAQVIHHFRQDLVRHPQLGAPLRAAYEWLGLELLPHWDLAALELRQWGNEADAAASGRMVVRASLTNRAAFAQPHPILRLELEDRFGNTVAMRDFEPGDYLKDPAQAARLIAPGASSEAELLLADPGREAVGYRLDVCLRESAALLRCAVGPG